MPNHPTQRPNKYSGEGDGESDNETNGTNGSMSGKSGSTSFNASLGPQAADGIRQERGSPIDNRGGVRGQLVAGTEEERDRQPRSRSVTGTSGEGRSRFPKVTDKQKLLPIRNRVFVGGLNDTINEEDLRQLFGDYGEVLEVLIKQRGNEKIRGDTRQADAALRAGAGERLSSHGVQLVVNDAVRRVDHIKSNGQARGLPPIVFSQTPAYGGVPILDMNGQIVSNMGPWSYPQTPMQYPYCYYMPGYTQAPMPGMPAPMPSLGPYSRIAGGQAQFLAPQIGCQCDDCRQPPVTRPGSSWGGMNGQYSDSGYGNSAFPGAAITDNRSRTSTPGVSRSSSSFGATASTPQQQWPHSEARYQQELWNNGINQSYGLGGGSDPATSVNQDYSPGSVNGAGGSRQRQDNDSRFRYPQQARSPSPLIKNNATSRSPQAGFNNPQRLAAKLPPNLPTEPRSKSSTSSSHTRNRMN